jgi:dihydroorotate dehydrogenase (NAD+) catalytic subunit
MRSDLDLSTPWMNAAGTAGFTPPERWPWTEPAGAWVTNPLSLTLRSPADHRAVISFPGGALLHSGLPNPGLNAILRRKAASWARSSLPAWVHIFGRTPDEIHQLVLRLEGIEGVGAIELGIGDDLSGADALAWAEAALGELPLVINLSLARAAEDWLSDLSLLGASAISLRGPRGALAGGDGRQVSGRLYGPSLLPLMFTALRQAQRHHLPIIAGAGVYKIEDGQALLNAGAWGIQLDTVLWL